MPKRTSRVLRDVKDYATQNGSAPVVPRSLSSFAPTAAPTTKSTKALRSGASSTTILAAGKSSANESFVHTKVAAYLKRLRSGSSSTATAASSTAVAPSLANVISTGIMPGMMMKAVESIVGTSASQDTKTADGEEAASAFQLRRFVMKSQTTRFDTVALSLLQLGASTTSSSNAATSDGASGFSGVLVIVSTQEVARQLSSYLTSVYRISSTMLIDGTVKLPSLPSATSQSAEDAGVIATPLTAIATADALCAIDKRSGLWKQMKHVIIDATGPTSSLLSEAKKLEYGKVGNALACLRVTVLAATPSQASDASLSFILPTRQRERPPVGLICPRSPLEVTYMVIQGEARFASLFSLCSNQSKTLRVIVHFATRQAALFVCNTLYALRFDGGKVFCDSEPTGAEANDGDDALKSATLNQNRNILQSIDEGLSAGEGCVLLSAYGLVPRTGDLFVQYDPMVDIGNMSTFIATKLTPSSAASVAKGAPSTAFGSPMPSSSQLSQPAVATPASAGKKRARTPPPPPSPSTPTALRSGEASFATLSASYKHVIVFLNPNEVQHGVALLNATGLRYNMSFKSCEPRYATTLGLQSMQKFKSLHTKLFAVQLAAYDAYRATMQVYSRLTPTNVYDVSKVNLQKIAESFGYSDAPLLDLRTKATVFRPKEDYYKIASMHSKKKRQAFKKFADETIVGEGPEVDPDGIQ